MNIVITGANRGLGYELTKKFAEGGHRVAACYFPGAAADELQQLAYEGKSLITLIPMDVTVENDVVKASELIRSGIYPVDAVVSNAGVLCDGDRTNELLQVEIEDLRTSLEVNLVGPAMVIRYFYPLMKKCEDSIFITITSEGASIGNVGRNFPAYSISKTAANKLVAIFKATAPDVRIFAMHPGRMNTVMGRTTAQIEPWESAKSIYGIVTGGYKTINRENWFVDYRGFPMDI